MILRLVSPVGNGCDLGTKGAVGVSKDAVEERERLIRTEFGDQCGNLLGADPS